MTYAPFGKQVINERGEIVSTSNCERLALMIATALNDFSALRNKRGNDEFEKLKHECTVEQPA